MSYGTSEQLPAGYLRRFWHAANWVGVEHDGYRAKTIADADRIARAMVILDRFWYWDEALGTVVRVK